MRVEILERETGFEPATSTLARSHSTTELLPLRNELFTEASAFCQRGYQRKILGESIYLFVPIASGELPFAEIAAK